jgi:hypothetical protein
MQVKESFVQADSVDGEHQRKVALQIMVGRHAQADGEGIELDAMRPQHDLVPGESELAEVGKAGGQRPVMVRHDP